jgi:hypothetical protein
MKSAKCLTARDAGNCSVSLLVVLVSTLDAEDNEGLDIVNRPPSLLTTSVG